MTEGIVLLVTASSKDEAQTLSEALVESNLVACVNIVDSVQSIFRWQGKLCKEAETLLILKSVRSRASQIVERIKQLHSYDVPEIIALPIVDGSEAYLDWIKEETGD